MGSGTSSGKPRATSAAATPQQPAPPQQATQRPNDDYGGNGSLNGLISAYGRSIRSSSRAGQGNGANSFNGHEGNMTGDYTADNNPALMKWQDQSDDTKVNRYLAKLGKTTTPSKDAQGYAYKQSPYQNMVIDQNLNAPVYAKLSASEFTKYCRATGLTPFYRGWSGPASKNRFHSADAFHTGTGMYGEGIYFGSKSTANSYGRTQTKAALSPNARVVDLDVVQKALGRSRSKAAFSNSGKTNSNFSNNSGEAQMALKMGYNVIRTSWSYVVLTRDAVVVQK